MVNRIWNNGLLPLTSFLRITKYLNVKCAKKRLIILHANVVNFVSVIHAAVVGIIVLVTTNLAIILDTIATKNLGILICQNTLTAKMKTALH